MGAELSRRRRPAAEAGMVLLLALFVLLLLSGIAAALVFRTLGETRVDASYRGIAQGYYSALAGLEEGRSRLLLSAPDAIPNSSLPTAAGEVLYIVNSTPGDPVVPTDPQSLYFDAEYLREFPGGGGTVTLLASNQPNAQTPFAIPYKWVRITVKTEYSSQQDVNQDGILDDTTPVVFDGSQQKLASGAMAGGLIYKVTALAVEPTGARRLLQYEVASASQLWMTPTAALVAGGSVELHGNMTVSGMNNCGSAPDLYGIVSGDNITFPGAVTVMGQPAPYLANTSLPSPAPAELLTQLAPFAIPIQEADPANVSYDAASATYRGSWVVLGDLTGFPPSPDQPAVPAIVYSGHSLYIEAGEGAGILLVDGDLQIEETFRYYGLIVATGAVQIEGKRESPVQIYGAIVHGGRFEGESSGLEGLEVLYDSCALSVAAEGLPKAIPAFKEFAP